MECRALAATASGAEREHILRMADQWERLARERQALLSRYPELAEPGEREEDGLA